MPIGLRQDDERPQGERGEHEGCDRPGTAARLVNGSREDDWWVYMVRCRDGTLYTGIARDVEARVALHNAGRGARYTRGRGPVTLVYRQPGGSRGDAQRREAALKALSRAAKEALIRD